MSRENVESLRRGFEAINSQDIERILAFADADFEVEVPPELSAEPDTYRGHDGMRRYWTSFQDAMEEIHFEAERIWDVGEDVVVAMHITAKGRRTAIAVEQRLVGVWTIRNHRAVRVRVFTTPAEALSAVGLSEPPESDL